MVHKVPGSEKWELAMRSRELWEKFAEDIKYQGMDPQEVLGWKKTGTPCILSSFCFKILYYPLSIHLNSVVHIYMNDVVTDCSLLYTNHLKLCQRYSG